MPRRIDSELLPTSNLDSTKMFFKSEEWNSPRIYSEMHSDVPKIFFFRIYATDIPRIVQECTQNILKNANYKLFRTPTNNHLKLVDLKLYFVSVKNTHYNSQAHNAQIKLPVPKTQEMLLVLL